MQSPVVRVEMQLTAARMHDHDIEMESDAERRRRLIRVRVQRHRRAEDDSRKQQHQETDQPRHNLNYAYFSQPPIIAASDGITALLSWLIYECSDIVEQRMIPGGRLTDVNTCNCYMYMCRNRVRCREEEDINQGTSAVTQLTRGADQHRRKLIRAFIGQLSSLLPLTVSLHSYIS